MSDTATLIAFVIAIVMSLAGGLLLGYFVGRMQNGHGEDIDRLIGQYAELDDRMDFIMAEITVVKARVMSADAESPAENVAPGG